MLTHPLSHLLSPLRPAAAIAALSGGLLFLAGAQPLIARVWAHLQDLFGRLPYGVVLGHLTLPLVGGLTVALALRSVRDAGDSAGQGR
ncbi:hypothetical protein BX264_3326 [Streptomyces sp. 2333.5]|uniref:hypothetical protein n=1 Tax=unclassified Streptomyces TaxID=2593676 RepID=UPI00089CE529|nr:MULTISPECIES: hypothetical protein [unclassified Streptomyces]PJJ02960.1 hypothetical protein BX264_3326 [Streptomyces sp. 2333.5]SED65999.1 hypothetical protein SAMN05428943_4084 [Streptomyces sp. 2314.4]SEE23410.1 hypothetical protein SAMN05428942_3429 [Streptomyces sp. 2112.2]